MSLRVCLPPAQAAGKAAQHGLSLCGCAGSAFFRARHSWVLSSSAGFNKTTKMCNSSLQGTVISNHIASESNYPCSQKEIDERL